MNWTTLQGENFSISGESYIISFDGEQTISRELHFPQNLANEPKEIISNYLVNLFKSCIITKKPETTVLCSTTIYDGFVQLYFHVNLRNEIQIQWVQKGKAFRIMMSEDRREIIAPIEWN